MHWLLFEQVIEEVKEEEKQMKVVQKLKAVKEGLKQKFIDRTLELSEIDTGIVPTISDKILTLSTCTGNGHEKRMVVQAVLAEKEGE